MYIYRYMYNILIEAKAFQFEYYILFCVWHSLEWTLAFVER